ncbi:MAG: fatty acid desaturase [Gemmataceae bacterium]|nr:fatty acid desaturase [Gemmataceae bacterium]
MTVPKMADEAARRWRASLPREWRRSSLAHGLTLALFTLALYVAAFLGYYLLPWFWARIACIFAIPMVIGGLFVIGHDAAHNSLTPVGWLNRLLGRLVMLPAYHPYTSWTHSHNTMHHGWTCFKGRHPDFPPFTKAEYDALPAWRRLLERFYRSALGVGFAYAFGFWLKHLLLPARKDRSPYAAWFQLDRLLVLAFFAGQCALSWILSANLHGENWRAVVHAVAGIVVPFGLWIWFMGFVSYIQHTHPLSAWYDDEEEWSFYTVQLKSTVHVVFPWPIEGMLNNIMDHAAHHLDPVIPLYRLPESQRLLEETAREHALIVHWTPWEYLRTCAACKLYDFERHCWTDWEGNPTSPLNLPSLLLDTPTEQPKQRVAS